MPEAVDFSKDAPGYADGMDYGKISAALVEAVKEMNKKFSELEAENKTQKEELKKLRAELDDLKSRVPGR